MYSGVFKSFAVTAFGAGCGFLCTVIVQNKLSFEDAGRFVLLLTIVQVLSMLVVLGEEKLLRRYFANFDVQKYNWPKHVAQTLLRSLPFLGVGLLWCYFQYNLTFLELFYCALAIECFVLAMLMGSILQSKEKFGFSAWALGGHRVFMIAFIVVLMFLGDRFNLINCETALMVSFLFSGLFALGYGIRVIAKGAEHIPSTYRKESFYLMATTVSMIVYTYTDRLIIPALTNTEDLAKYFAILNPFMVFEMVAMALVSVLTVKVARSNISVTRCTLNMLLIAGIGFLVSILFFDTLIHYLYSGKYDDTRDLIPIIAVTKAIKFIFTVPAAVIGGRLGRKALKTFSITNLALTPINVFVVWILAAKMALTGLALGMLIICAGWTLTGFITIWIYSKTRVTTDDHEGPLNGMSPQG